MNMYLAIFFCCISTLSIITASPTNLTKHVEPGTPSVRIINGEETADIEAPYFVTVLAYDDQSSRNLLEFCGGSILSRNYILTAAHCMSGSGYYEVIAGTHLLHGPNRVLKDGTKYTIHSNYAPDPLVHYDLAILALPTPLDFSNSAIKPVLLPTRTDAKQSYVGRYARIYGRGDTRDNQPYNVQTEELRYVVTEVISNSDCLQDFSNLYGGNMCTLGLDGGKRIGGCKGDSGGPLVYLDTQIGVVSYGGDKCEAGEPTVYTDVGQFLDWIESKSDVIIKN